MAGYTCQYDVLNDLSEMFSVMNSDMKAQIKQTAQTIGQELKTNTENAIPKAAVAKHGAHLADEVKMSVSVSDKAAKITVNGGYKTGGYWFIVDNGHVAKNGKFVGGAHFTDKAYQQTDVEGPVEDLIARLTNG